MTRAIRDSGTANPNSGVVNLAMYTADRCDYLLQQPTHGRFRLSVALKAQIRLTTLTGPVRDALSLVAFCARFAAKVQSCPGSSATQNSVSGTLSCRCHPEHTTLVAPTGVAVGAQDCRQHVN